MCLIEFTALQTNSDVINAVINWDVIDDIGIYMDRVIRDNTEDTVRRAVRRAVLQQVIQKVVGTDDMMQLFR